MEFFLDLLALLIKVFFCHAKLDNFYIIELIIFSSKNQLGHTIEEKIIFKR